MKRFWIILLIIILVSTFRLNIYDYEHFSVPLPLGDVVVEHADTVVPVADDVRIVSISAVGDCTLGTDVSFGIGGSFEAELMANYYDYRYYFNNVRQYLQSDDITIINFEGALSPGGVRENKEYTFKGPPEYINILTCSSVEAANVANNHSKDYGETALLDTKNLLNGNGITSFGGSDVAVREVNGIRVGFIGTNALTYEGRTGFAAALDALKAMNPQLIIASFHWGSEGATVADGSQIQLAHMAIDSGVDLVLGHHPHVLQGIEKYKGKYIVYSLGNFCFGGNKNPVDKDTMIFKQNFKFVNGTLTDEDDVGIVPCSVSSITSRNNYQPTPLDGADFDRVREKVISRSASYTGVENIKFFR